MLVEAWVAANSIGVVCTFLPLVPSTARAIYGENTVNLGPNPTFTKNELAVPGDLEPLDRSICEK